MKQSTIKDTSDIAFGIKNCRLATLASKPYWVCLEN